MKPKIKLALLAGLVLLGAACKQKSRYETDNDPKAADSVMLDSTPSAPKLLKTADMRFKVKNVAQTSENISALVTKDSGMVMHHNVASTVEQTHDVKLNNDSVMRISSVNTNADMTVKLPVEKVDAFLNAVAQMGLYVTERKMDIEDRSLDYLQYSLKLKNRLDLVAREKTGKVTIKNPTAVLNLKDDLVDEQINSKMIDDAVKYSTISLSFYQNNAIYKEVVADDDPSAYDLPFFSRAINALDNGWHLFGSIIIGLMNLWVLIVAGIVVWVVITKRKMIGKAVGTK